MVSKKPKKINPGKKKGLGKSLNELIKSQNKNRFLKVNLESKHYGETIKCGKCKSTVPINSKSCPTCKAEFHYEDKAECGKCKTIVPVSSTKCRKCGALFQ